VRLDSDGTLAVLTGSVDIAGTNMGLALIAAEAYGVASFYALISLEERPADVLHVCTDLACQLAGAGDHVDAVNVSNDRVRHVGAAGEHVDEVHAEAADLDPELAGERKLWIGIDREHPLATACEQHADVDRGGGFAHTALLVRYGTDHHETSCRLL